MSTKPSDVVLSLVPISGHFTSNLDKTRRACNTAMAWNVLNIAVLEGGLFLMEVSSSDSSEYDSCLVADELLAPCECVCECVSVYVCECVCECVSVYVCECVCVCKRERERECVCVCV